MVSTLWGEVDNIVTRKCLNCYKVKPLEDFEWRQATEGNLYRNQCKACRTQHKKELARIKKDYSTLMPKEGSDYRCPICKKNEIEKQNHGTRFIQQSRKLRVWVYDHEHGGNFRDIICQDCNVGLGRFSDDPETLRNAANYIESYNKLELNV